MKDGYKLCLVLLVLMITTLWLAAGCASRKAAAPEPGTAASTSGTPTLPAVSGDLKKDQAVFEKKCSACHSLSRPLSVKKSAKDWRLTVERMQLKVFSHISDEDAEMIIKYLVATRHL